MIDVRELRVGNIVLVEEWEYNFKARPITHCVVSTTETEVDSIHEDGINQYLPCEDAPQYVDYNRIFGIPLSPEILERLNAKKQLRYECAYIGNIWVQWYDDTQKRVWINSNYVGIIHLEFVHELQNLFYTFNQVELSLTNTELSK